jgi:hypothetical protein
VKAHGQPDRLSCPVTLPQLSAPPPPPSAESDESDEDLQQSAELLYGMIHARYIITTNGLEVMVSRTPLWRTALPTDWGDDKTLSPTLPRPVTPVRSWRGTLASSSEFLIPVRPLTRARGDDCCIVVCLSRAVSSRGRTSASAHGCYARARRSCRWVPAGGVRGVGGLESRRVSHGPAEGDSVLDDKHEASACAPRPSLVLRRPSPST